MGSSTFALLEALEPRQMLSAGLAAEDLSLAAPINLPPIGEVSLSGQITPESSGLFTVTAKSKGLLRIAAAGDGLVDPVLRVFNQSGRLVARDSGAAHGEVESLLKLHAKAGRTYYVQISGARGDVGGYSLRLRSTPIDDLGNTLATARRWRLGYSGSGSVRASVNYSGDVDFLSIIAPQSGSLKLDMAPYRQTLSSELVVYDASGNIVAAKYVTDGYSVVSVSVDVQKGQVYYVRASAHDSGTGMYTIRAATLAPAPVPPPPPPAPEPTPDPTPEPTPDPTPAPQDIQPGSSIAAQLVQSGGGMQLLVVGTNSADTITISVSGGSVVLTTAISSQSFSGATSVMIYGFGGDDTIRMTSSVTLSATIYGGDGNDTIYDASAGAAAIYGGMGDDMIVTVGGGPATIYGQDGADSVWMDSSDQMMDAAVAETSAGAIHRIAAFYQPYTTDSGAAQYVPLTIDGQNFTDPSAGGTTYRSFASSPLFLNGPDYNDVRQGNVGDCYFVASLSSIAQADPVVLRQMIAPMGDGTYAVRFYRGGKEVYVRIDADLPTYSSGSLAYAKLSPQGETWVAMLEKAYAYFRKGQNSYASLSGGWMPAVYAEITNLSSPSKWISSTPDLAGYIATQMAAGHAVTVASAYDAADPVVGGHAYMVKSVEITQSGTYVTVYNPWGVDGANYDSDRYDGLMRLPLATFNANFDAAAVCMA